MYRVIVMVTSLTKQMAPLNDGHPNSSAKCALSSRELAARSGNPKILPGSWAELRHGGARVAAAG